MHQSGCQSTPVTKVSELGASWRHSAPTKGMALDPAADLRKRPFGSKFWPLADELSSDDEDDSGGDQEKLVPAKDFLKDALAVGYTVDDVLSAEAQLQVVDVTSNHSMC